MANSQSTQSTNLSIAKIGKSKSKPQKFVQQILAIALITQAILIGVTGNLDILDGKPILNVLQGMITQSIELIIKAQGVQKSLKNCDRAKG